MVDPHLEMPRLPRLPSSSMGDEASSGDGATSGLALAREFYRRVVAALVQVPHAACLLGEGSEVLGFDTRRSRDHEWGPRVQILVAAEHVGMVRQRVAIGLPSLFDGFETEWFSLSAGAVTHHVQVSTVDDWIVRTLGRDPRPQMDAAEWLGLPQQRLLNVTAGEVFRDDMGELTRIRQLLTWYPRDVWTWMMLSNWHLVGEIEPMRGRCIETGDAIGERLLTARLCRLLMELAFLQERRYWPYGKWFGAAFQRLDVAAALSEPLQRALTERESEATRSLRKAVAVLGHRQSELGVGGSVTPRYGPFDVGINGAVRPYEVSNAGEYVAALREAISDPRLRDLVQVGAIDQLTHAHDAVVTHTDWPARLTDQYREAMRRGAPSGE